MARTFNCGVGAVLIVDAALAGPITEKLLENGVAADVIGHVVKKIDKLRFYISVLFKKNNFGNQIVLT
ncbi:hypothetical protein DPMN_119074 [Dreissena polymorpha]|uniref:Uncharacterized protein n=1 Tax=Dreissena polymorpha TaxID=45954 RepID=A0A9D4JMD1_DREPO|nr:hypothetical protein DPMN_119074 [Dreissena polymorpha]